MAKLQVQPSGLSADPDTAQRAVPHSQPALDAYFDWTFYDQGTRSLVDGTEARTGSVGDFFEQALVFFGDPNPNLPGKGRRLADLIRQQRSLIILDGLEPLQQPPGHPQAGRLLDPDLNDLLRALAQLNPGLCIITSRQALTDIDGLRRKVYVSIDLDDLPIEVAVQLLRQFDIKGADNELASACETFHRHALCITLLGRFLCDAHGGDVRRIDHIRDLKRADDLTRPERHRSAWKILESYEAWLSTAQLDGNPKTLAVLRLTGLFDRTATPDCLQALRNIKLPSFFQRWFNSKAQQINEVFCSITTLSNDEWNILLRRLERADLIKLRKLSYQDAATSDQIWAIDAHPLMREYFAKKLKQTHPEAFKAAHSLLFDHLCTSAPTITQVDDAGRFAMAFGVDPGSHDPSLHDLQPLHQAVVHGCAAERKSESYRVYYERIWRGNGFSYSVLRSNDADLGALAAFFETPWTQVATSLNSAWLLNAVSLHLKALGRIEESWKAIETATSRLVSDEKWQGAVDCMNHATRLTTILGCMESGVCLGRRAIELSDLLNSNLDSAKDSIHFHDLQQNAKRRRLSRTALADVLHHAGSRAEALSLFAEAERMENAAFGRQKVLVSQAGFQYSELILNTIERDAWPAKDPLSWLRRSDGDEEATESWAQATVRSEFALKSALDWDRNLLDIAFHRLTLARAGLYRALRTPMPGFAEGVEQIVIRALRAFRQANTLDYLPLALLTAAFYHGTLGENLEEAERLLEEAQQIAERGPMPLYLADVHLHRARLWGAAMTDKAKGVREKFPHIDPKAELAEARRLIEKHGYWRRKEELEDAEAAAVNW